MRFELLFAPDHDVEAGARECERAVFGQVFGNSAQELDEEYGPYDASSVFVAIREAGGDVVASARLIVPGPVGLKSLVDVSRPPWSMDGPRAARAAGLDLARTWDVATVAVRRQAARPGLLAAALYHAIYRGSSANDARWLVMIMDLRARRLLQMLHLDTQPLPSARPGTYLGSTCIPLWCDLVASRETQRREDLTSHRLLALGIGLDGISVPPPAAFVLHRSVPSTTQSTVPRAQEMTERSLRA